MRFRGLSGAFEVNLQFVPDVPQATATATDDPVATAVEGPSIFTARQEQLGLKLESNKGPVNVLVIDSVQKPSEN